jgi:predicted nucleic acid-binding protein
MTQRGFLLLATNPNAFGEEAVNMSEAWELFDRFLADPRIGFLLEPTDVEAIWRANSVRRTFSPKMWNDAYLAAFAFVSGCTVVTFDTAFAQYSATTSEILR